MIETLIALTATLAVIVVRGFLDEETVERDWELFLQPWGEEILEELRQRAAGEDYMVQRAHQRALDALAAGRREDAVRLVEVALRVVERTSPDWIMVLRRVSVISRMAATVAPSGPLNFSEYRSQSLSTLVLIAQVLHWFLVSTAERLRLRAYVLRRGFALVARRMVLGRREVESGDAARGLRTLELARADLGQLSTETVRTVDALLRSLAAQPRG